MNNQVIDLDSALERLGGDKEFLVELLEDLNDQIRESIPSIEKSIKDSDFTELRAKAHSIKGAAANLSVIGLANKFSELEQKALTEDGAGATELLENIKALKDEFDQALEKI